MTNMVERVARALHEWQSTIPWEVTSQQDIAYARAKVAIKAMRDPTDEMIAAGLYPCDEEGTRIIWTDMIDAALSSSKKED